MIRWIIFLAIIAAIDFYAFQAFKTAVKSSWLHYSYWVVNLLVIGNLVFRFYGLDRSDFSHSHGYAFAFFITLLLPKIILLVFMFGEDIIRWFSYGFNNDTRTTFNSQSLTSRRKFISQIALGIAAIPFASFLYGIFKGKYNFKVLKYTLHFED